jgi:hypothetical protein
MWKRIYLHVDNITGKVSMPNWKEICGNVEFEFRWKDNNNITAQNIIIPENFSKGSFKNRDKTITNIRFINNIDLDIIINGYFLIFLTKLKSIDLEGLSKTKIIQGSFFLSYCHELEEINLYPFSNVMYINSYFLSDCCKIKEIDLLPLKNIKVINDCFLTNCRNLEELDLTPLKNITEIGISFSSCCFNLKNIKFYDSLKVKKIGIQFMRFCENLNNIDLSPFSKVNKIGELFLADCENLKNIVCHEDIEKVVLTENNNLSYKLNYIISQFKNDVIIDYLQIINNHTIVQI